MYSYSERGVDVAVVLLVLVLVNVMLLEMVLLTLVLSMTLLVVIVLLPEVVALEILLELPVVVDKNDVVLWTVPELDVIDSLSDTVEDEEDSVPVLIVVLLLSNEVGVEEVVSVLL